ncbi:trafficking protein particle complex 5 [Emiliania huxleyi CCMP1516]|uniref:Trafficking protein particle complex subunit n=2 Tax=Emiliania huxleyi TaxID=2903 RepID=A0A0D3L155_EMIH1|nr:trafficking protein particle complex 5 [Emiliania huxleyi CCMP1516]EOD41740.1 trafficking protein particle complex 5 [Emiliania huxleyi CCMP1516]|eukprot:XP_005794169.1 trafficking protein particle complex 5 [Emiliania huxleyi CCMP1516]
MLKLRRPPCFSQLCAAQRVVSQSAFAFLFSEMIQYSQTRVNTADELIAKLEDAGVGVGRRALELACWRERSSKRETRALWKSLFGAHADSLQKVQDSDDEFMIVEKEPLVNAFISSAPVNCAAFVAGGRTPSPPESGRLGRRLAAAQFPAEVSAHDNEEGATVLLIKFAPEVLEREKRQA